ncbi:Hypothetical protein CINCED_3A004990 [Cinara cedri]|uniref:UDP-glucuronosyltransferase n=1 Tax=Cinara cedri TaxID=506608 RepID=A0A5E4MKI2_9HEMI|nr:Hypothetical protein CINCED_3A004990 [Cinara cedri]
MIGLSYYAGVFCVLSILQTHSYEILVIFPTTAQSHYRVIQPLIHGLLDRGHKVTSITNFPDVNARANLSYINITGLKPHSKFSTNENGLMKSISRVIHNVNTYANVLNYPPVANLLKYGKKFDLVITEFFTTTPMFAPIATVVEAPIIGVCPMITFPWLNDVMGIETKMSYMPNIFNKFTDCMSFHQRLINFFTLLFQNSILNWFYTSKINEVNKHYFGIQTESLIESMANISMIMTNNYPSMFMSLPKVPGIIEVGGIHVEAEKPLSKDLEDFINNAEYGVILFSLGSVVSESSLGIDKINNIFETFSKLKQRVIMKLDVKSYKSQFSNVKIVKWFPQRDLLAHPKVLLFISHAGIMSVIETIHCGKPMVAIPIFGDQPLNANLLVKKQIAVIVDYKNLKGDQFFNAINTALTEEYRINAIKLQQLYNDRPQTPLETAIYWTEYVIRNKNESKGLLKSSLIHLNSYETCLIDVFAVCVLPIIIAIE